MKKILSDIPTKEPILKSNNTTPNADEASFDALLDEINKQKRQNQSLQAEISGLRNTEVRLQKNVERLRLENQDLEQQIKKMTQRVRELEIEISLPVNERTLEVNRAIITPIPPAKAKENIISRFAVVAVLMLCTVAIVWKWTNKNNNASQSFLPKAASVSQALNEADNTSTSNPSVVQVSAPITPAVTTPTQPEPTTAVAAAPTTNTTNTPNNAVTNSATPEEGYLLIDNPLNKDFMVRVYTGYQRGARELAFVNTGDKFRIRAQSPEKMRRQYVMNGKKITVEDYFYKVSDKEQWVFGFFTTKRTATITQ